MSFYLSLSLSLSLFLSIFQKSVSPHSLSQDLRAPACQDVKRMSPQVVVNVLTLVLAATLRTPMHSHSHIWFWNGAATWSLVLQFCRAAVPIFSFNFVEQMSKLLFCVHDWSILKAWGPLDQKTCE